MLICEELFLLLTHEGGGRAAMSQRGWGLTAGVLTDLLLQERIELSEDKDPKLVQVDPSPTGDPVLDAVLPTLAERRGRRLSRLVKDRKLDPTEVIGRGLAEAGVVRAEPTSFLGIRRTSFPQVDGEPEAQLRNRLRRTLAGEAAPQPTDGPVLAILQGLGVLKKILGPQLGGLKGRALKERVAQIAAQTPAAEAVKRAVDQLMAAVMTAAVMPAVMGGGS